MTGSSILTLGLAAAAAAALFSCTVADAATTVAVIELGAGGVARRTTSPSGTSGPSASIPGVLSFWNSMHDVDADGEKKKNGRRSRSGANSLPYPGMTVVPDLFKRADGGVAIGISGSAVDLKKMPSISTLKTEESVGEFRLSGLQGSALMEKTGKDHQVMDESSVSGSSIEEKVKAAASGSDNKLGSFSVRVDDEASAAAVDKHISKALDVLQKQVAETGSTVVVHLVIEEEDDDYPRRRLEDQQDEDENADEDGDEDGDNNQNNNNWNNDGGDDGGDEKTIFQIQYFNVVLWTSVGLVVLLIVTVGLTVAMPLEPDTLLFGESAKIVGE